MAQKRINDLQLRSDFDATCNLPSDDLVQTWRVTGQQIKDYVLSNGSVTDAKTNFTKPTIQKFTSGSGTYTTPAGVKYIKIKMVGGGGGGGGSQSAAGSAGSQGTTGGTSSFGTSLLTVVGGLGGANPSTGGPGTGGQATTNSPALTLSNVAGSEGGAAAYSTISTIAQQSGHGGPSPFGGSPGGRTGGTVTGSNGASNSGAGGGGAGVTQSAFQNPGHGGGAGGYIEAVIHSPTATYAYAVGAGGAGGSAGTSGAAGGVGGSGVIIVEEYYQ